VAMVTMPIWGPIVGSTFAGLRENYKLAQMTTSQKIEYYEQSINNLQRAIPIRPVQLLMLTERVRIYENKLQILYDRD